jgi:hypothetical protein
MVNGGGLTRKVGTILSLPLRVTDRGVSEVAGVTRKLLKSGQAFLEGTGSNVDSAAASVLFNKRGGKRNHKNKNKSNKNKSKKNKNKKNKTRKNKNRN